MGFFLNCRGIHLQIDKHIIDQSDFLKTMLECTEDKEKGFELFLNYHVDTVHKLLDELLDQETKDDKVMKLADYLDIPMKLIKPEPIVVTEDAISDDLHQLNLLKLHVYLDRYFDDLVNTKREISRFIPYMNYILRKSNSSRRFPSDLENMTINIIRNNYRVNRDAREDINDTIPTDKQCVSDILKAFKTIYKIMGNNCHIRKSADFDDSKSKHNPKNKNYLF